MALTVEQTRERNWAKARLLGHPVPSNNLLTEEENKLMQQIVQLKGKLLDNWDSNTEVLIGHPLPPHKCHFCGRRSNVQHTTYYNEIPINVCKKHYNELAEELKM